MSNRVEELESKVAELQAAVNGLTEELVETKERVRLLEDQVEVDLTAGSRPVGHASFQPDAEAEQTESTEQTDSAEAAETDDADASGADAEDSHLRESPAQAQSRAETSAQPSDDASFIDADSEDPLPDETDELDDPADDEVKSDEGESEDEAEAAEDDSDIIVA